MKVGGQGRIHRAERAEKAEKAERASTRMGDEVLGTIASLGGRGGDLFRG